MNDTGYKNNVAFVATNEIYCPFDGLVWFEIESDIERVVPLEELKDKVSEEMKQELELEKLGWYKMMLLVDGQPSLRVPWPGDRVKENIPLGKGVHKLELRYIETFGKARAKFNCEKHVFLAKQLKELERKFNSWESKVSQGDINLDGTVDVYDLAKVGANFGEKTD